MKKRLYTFIATVLMVLLVPTMVSAKVLVADENTTELEGKHNESKLIFGNSVYNSAEIDGLAMVFGNQVNGDGKTDIGGYAGNIITISDDVERDLFVAGNMITITDKAKLNRDLFIAGNMITVSSDVARNLNVAGSVVDISGIEVKGNAHIYADSIIIDEKTKIVGTLTIDETCEVEGMTASNYGKLVKEKSEEVVEESLQTKIVDAIISVLTSYVSALIILLLFSKVRKALDKTKFEGKTVIGSSFKGLAALIVVPIVSIFAMVTGILLPISLITLALYVFAIYMAGILASYIFTHNIWKLKLKPNFYLELLAGIVVVKVLSYVPYVGGLVGAVMLFYGLGLICELVLGLIKNK